MRTMTKVQMTIEVEHDDVDSDDMIAAVASCLADQEHHFQCDGLPSVEFRIAAVAWEGGRVDAGATMFV